MIQAAFFGLFDFVEKHRWAQIVLTVGLVLIAVRAKEEVDEARGRAQSDRKWQRRSIEQEHRGREFIETTKEEAAHEADKALEARDTAGPVDPDRMSGAQRERIFGRHAAAGGSGRGGGDRLL